MLHQALDLHLERLEMNPQLSRRLRRIIKYQLGWGAAFQRKLPLDTREQSLRDVNHIIKAPRLLLDRKQE